MKLDLETDAIPEAHQTDVCIAGSGVAGLMLADALRNRGLRVDVLEAGGMQMRENGHSPFTVTCSGQSHSGATEGRCRVFGGTSARWGGQLLPFGHEVFSARPGRAEIDWPISPREVYHHAGEVLKALGVNDHSFESDFLHDIGKSNFLLQSEELRVRYSKWLPFSRRNLALTVGKTLEADATARVILNANVVAIGMNAAGDRVEFLHCRTSDGREVQFRALLFVLATGTIEVIRLLLSSWQGVQKGIGNAHGQVGQYFHDHVGVVVGEIHPNSVRRWEHSMAPWCIKGVLHTARLEAHPRLVAERQWLDVMACCTFETAGTGFERFRQYLQQRQRGRLSFRQLLALVSHLPSHMDLLRLALAAKLRKRRLLPRGGRVEIQISVEQKPASSIRLAPECDQFGLPCALVDWRVSPEELQTVHEFRELLSKQWKPAWGEATWHDYATPEAYLPHVRDTFHMMGGARMGTDARNSVVDSNLKVHGVENLYIASCAVYPSGGSSNPTFTLMCLCIRLSETLNQTARDHRRTRDIEDCPEEHPSQALLRPTTT